MDASDAEYFAGDSRQPFQAKIPVHAFTSDAGLWENRGGWTSQGLDTTTLPGKAEIVATYELNANEEADLDDLVALGRTAVDKPYWRTKFKDSMYCIEARVRFQTMAEWQSFLEQAALYNPNA